VNKGIQRVVIGILDPNPTICGKGYWALLERDIDVELFHPHLARQIRELNKAFVRRHTGGINITSAFDWVISQNKNSIIQPYIGLGWGDALTVQPCPIIREGWLLASIRVRLLESPFELPQDHRSPYDMYFRQNYEEKRFVDDGTKFMVAQNPTAFSDTMSLILDVRPTKYSHAKFYQECIAISEAAKKPLIDTFVRGQPPVAKFAQTFNMQLVIITSDSKILLTLRSPKVTFDPNTWSASIEEQLSRDDLVYPEQEIVFRWAARALREELGLTEDTYHHDNLRLLSVFMEAHCLDISLCVYAELRLDETSLETILKHRSRSDYEFVDWDFLDLDKQVVLRELLRPSRLYHPTARYRLLYTLLKKFGSPTNEDIQSITQTA
jgi:hypothetical protein